MGLMHEKRTIFSGPQNPFPIACNEKQHCADLNHRHVSRLIFAQLCFSWGLLHVILLQASRRLENHPAMENPKAAKFSGRTQMLYLLMFHCQSETYVFLHLPFTSDIWGVFVILYSATHSHLLQTLCFWEELYKSVVASWMILMNDYHMFPHRFHSDLHLSITSTETFQTQYSIKV